LDRHERFHVYFTPTSASWLNMVERFFRDLTENQLRRGIFKNLEQLVMAIGNYIDQQPESETLHLDRKSFRHPRKSHSRPSL
jgi:hypothetical protein